MDESSPLPPNLTLKQQRFVEAYLGEANGNATAAAKAAGYPAKSAHSVGSENLRKPEVRAAIDERLSEIAMPANEVLARLSEMARATMADFLELDREGFPRLSLAKAKRLQRLHLVKEVTLGPEGLKVKLYDAQAALVKLGTHHGLFVERQQHEHSGAGGGPIRLEYVNDWRPRVNQPERGDDPPADAAPGADGGSQREPPA